MPDTFYGSFCLILHSHIPYVVNHGLMGEEWLFEAAAETYIPLLNIFNRLVREGIQPKVTINLSPVLAEQLHMPLFGKRFTEYCRQKIEFAIRDAEAFRTKDSHMAWLANLWKRFYGRTLRIFADDYKEDLIGAFRELNESGAIEVITCGATHAYFPALLRDQSIHAQVKMAAKSHEELIGSRANGIWLPECGYRPSGSWRPPFSRYRNSVYFNHRPGIEEILSHNGMRFFVIDQVQLQRGSPKDIDLSPLEIFWVKNGSHPVSVFVRDSKISEQIWNHQIGYPGDPSYLEFHKKHSPGQHRYWRITDRNLDMAYKTPYHPHEVRRERIPQHAGHYKWLIKRALMHRFHTTGQSSLIVTAFDSELFGHWWFEGPTWLYQLLKWVRSDPEISLCTCSEYLDRQSPRHLVHLPESSWGKGYDSSTWINSEVEWVWERLYWAELEMGYLVNGIGYREEEILRRILRQAIRELLILQASDWEFMITNWSTKDYAERRVVEHHADFSRLATMAWSYVQENGINETDERFLKECEHRDAIFSAPDPVWYKD
ncbi:MAG: 1,4-alpha-glucan branching protein domain-containing protein [bacterium]